jgi:ABC-type glycerol-3-phosphate transport system substrate-binding protein
MSFELLVFGDKRVITLIIISSWTKRFPYIVAHLVLIVMLVYLVSYEYPAVMRRRPGLTIAVPISVGGNNLKLAAARYASKKGMAVEVVELPYERLYSKIGEGLTTPGPGPFDVIMIDDPWLPGLIKKRLVEPLAVSESDMADFVGNVRRVAQDPYCSPKVIDCESRYFGIPFTANAALFGYWQEKLRAAGCHDPPFHDWDEVVQCADQIASANNRQKEVAATNGRMRDDSTPFAIRGFRGNALTTDFIPIVWSYDPTALPSRLAPPHPLWEINAAATSSPVAKALNTYAHLAALSPVNSMQFNDAALAVWLLRGNSDMAIMWASLAMEVTLLRATDRHVPLAGNALQFKSLPGTSELGTWLLCVPHNAAQRDAALGFIQWATNEENLEKAAHNGNPPPRISVLTNPKLNTDFPFFPDLLSTLKSARPRPRTAAWHEIEQILSDALARAFQADDKGRRHELTCADETVRGLLPKADGLPPQPLPDRDCPE